MLYFNVDSRHLVRSLEMPHPRAIISACLTVLLVGIVSLSFLYEFSPGGVQQLIITESVSSASLRYKRDAENGGASNSWQHTMQQQQQQQLPHPGNLSQLQRLQQPSLGRGAGGQMGRNEMATPATTSTTEFPALLERAFAVPNHVIYIWCGAERTFEFRHYLSVKSVLKLVSDIS